MGPGRSVFVSRVGRRPSNRPRQVKSAWERGAQVPTEALPISTSQAYASHSTCYLSASNLPFVGSLRISEDLRPRACSKCATAVQLGAGAAVGWLAVETGGGGGTAAGAFVVSVLDSVYEVHSKHIAANTRCLSKSPRIFACILYFGTKEGAPGSCDSLAELLRTRVAAATTIQLATRNLCCNQATAIHGATCMQTKGQKGVYGPATCKSGSGGDGDSRRSGDGGCDNNKLEITSGKALSCYTSRFTLEHHPPCFICART